MGMDGDGDGFGGRGVEAGVTIASRPRSRVQKARECPNDVTKTPQHVSLTGYLSRVSVGLRTYLTYELHTYKSRKYYLGQIPSYKCRLFPSESGFPILEQGMPSFSSSSYLSIKLSDPHPHTTSYGSIVRVSERGRGDVSLWLGSGWIS